MGLLREIYSDNNGCSCTINNIPVYVDVLRTDSEHTKGFQGRVPPGPNEGLLFLYPEPRVLGFWMKSVPFDLQLLAFDESNTLIQVMHLYANDESIRMLNRPCKLVLELPRYWCQKNKIGIGAKLVMSNPGMVL
jgi:uncharacterized membrane protein (UPF0127 family)